MKKELRTKGKNYLQEIKETIKAISNFTLAASLLLVSAYSGWSAMNTEFSIDHADKALLFSSVLIVLLGLEKFVKTLRNK
jgi:hypothetical protein